MLHVFDEGNISRRTKGHRPAPGHLGASHPIDIH
jgi:hypothetical protein